MDAATAGIIISSIVGGSVTLTVAIMKLVPARKASRKLECGVDVLGCNLSQKVAVMETELQHHAVHAEERHKDLKKDLRDRMGAIASQIEALHQRFGAVLQQLGTLGKPGGEQP